jgi:3D (Asp-Asp-Asp) domain-containing protein
MHNEILNVIRVALLGVLVITGATLGITSEPSSCHEPTAACLEIPADPTTDPTEAPAEPSAPTETETTTETTTPETEPPAVTEPPTEPATEPTEPEPIEEWRNLGTYTLTAYCSCQICCGEYALNRPIDGNGDPIVYTSIGAIAKAGVTIAVDPRVIPYGSEIKINDHVYIAQDTGGAITGARIDIYFDDHQEALEFGLQTAEIYILA